MYTVKRSPHNPILTPSPERRWEMVAFNGCPIVVEGKVHLLYRAMGSPDRMLNPATSLSVVGHATSSDGAHFDIRKEFITPSETYDAYGCEDPRVTFFEGKYYTFYTALGGIPFGAQHIKIACTVGSTIDTIDEKHLVTPFNGKAMALFPERINGKVTVILAAHTDEPPVKIAIAQADTIEELWTPEFWGTWHKEIDAHTLAIVRSDEDFAEVGAVPVKTEKGWLLVYSYIDEYHKGNSRTFGIEALLLDLHNPQKIVGRTQNPFLIPETPYEGFGIVRQVVFPSGALVDGDRLDVYYGGADTVCAMASLHLPHLLAVMTTDREATLMHRSPQNPVMRGIPEHAWESKLAFNPTAIMLDGITYIVYRAMGDDNTSVMGLAISRDGLHIDERLPNPIYTPRANFEQKHGSPTGNSGCEDPRLTVMNGEVFMMYTAYEGVGTTRVALTRISVEDFKALRFDKWSEPVLITPAGIDEKDVAMFPEKINDEYVFLHRVSPMICMSTTHSPEFQANTINRCIELLGPRAGSWEAEKVGIAGTPLKTDIGWLLIYHAVSKEKHYSLGAVLLDLENPAVVIGRTVDPILTPRDEWEKIGEINNVVFSCGAVINGERLIIYYGGADAVVCIADCSLSELLSILKPASL
ncbi:MAG: hypothetical protein WAX38_02710 [Minisyncoccia bacterium]